MLKHLNNHIYAYVLDVLLSITFLYGKARWQHSFFKLHLDLYKITHFRLGLTGITGHNTALIASSNTVFRPFWVKAEHSRYFTALISFAIAKPYNKTSVNSLATSTGHLLKPWQMKLHTAVESSTLTCGYVIGASFLSLSFSMVPLSSRRSSFVPTNIIGVLGQWCLTSGYHWKRILHDLYMPFFHFSAEKQYNT